MSDNMNVYEKSRAVPQEALKPIVGGRLKGMSDINPMWRIKMLTELFGMCGIGWKTKIVDRRLERGNGEEVVCFVDIELYVKVDGEWSEPIPGMGGSSFVTAERNGIHTSDECFKMAYTDAISVACKSLGFAADVYFANDRTKYSQGNEEPAQTPQPQPTAPRSQSSAPIPTAPTRPAYNTPHSFKRDAYSLREELFMTWNDLQSFAERVLERKVGKVTAIQDEKDWEVIVRELKTYQSQPSAALAGV